MNTSGQENQRISTLLCANSCGFYGNPTTRNLCSKCYRNALLNEQKQQQQNGSQLTEKLVGCSKASSDASRSLQSPKSESFLTEQAKDQSLNEPTSIAFGKSNEKLALAYPSEEEREKATNLKSQQQLSSDYNSNLSQCLDQLYNNESQRVNTGVSNQPVGEVSLYSDANSDSAIDGLTSRLSIANKSTLSSPTNYSQSYNSSKAEAPSTHIVENEDSILGTLHLNSEELNPPNSSSGPSSNEQESTQVNKNRCFKCNKKIGLLGFQCRCSYYFCGNHRHADCHDCPFDYKTFGRKQLSKANQKIVADKLNRI